MVLETLGNKPSRLLDTILPGQFDNYFVELAALFAAGDPSEEQIDGLSRKFAIRICKILMVTSPD